MNIDLKKLKDTIIVVGVLLIFLYGASVLMKVDFLLVLSVFSVLYMSYDIYEEI